jgi:hypothetical protein
MRSGRRRARRELSLHDRVPAGVMPRPQERRIQASLSITKGFRVFGGDWASLQGLIKVDGTFA